MPNYLILSALLAIGIPSTASACNTYRFRPHAMFDVAAIKQLAARPIVIRPTSPSGDSANLVVHPFDSEDQPVYGSWRGLAVVYVTRGDLAEDTVGGLLLQALTEAPTDLATVRTSRNAGSAEMLLGRNKTCSGFPIRLQTDGTLLVDGQVVGKLAE